MSSACFNSGKEIGNKWQKSAESELCKERECKIKQAKTTITVHEITNTVRIYSKKTVQIERERRKTTS